MKFLLVLLAIAGLVYVSGFGLFLVPAIPLCYAMGRFRGVQSTAMPTLAAGRRRMIGKV